MHQEQTKNVMNIYQMFQNSLYINQHTNGITELTENSSTTCTYEELRKKTENLSASLSGIGLHKGDRVGLFIENGIERIYKVLALVKCGVVFVPLDPAYKKQMIEQIIRETHLTHVILGESQKTKDLWDQYNININVLTINSFYDTIPNSMNGLLSDDISEEDPICILYTSGNSGVPKGVVLSHRNVLAMVAWYTNTYKLCCTKDVMCLHSHCTWITYWMEMFIAVLNCIPCVAISEETVKNFPLFSRLLKEHSVSLFIGSPTLFFELLRWTEINSSLKLINIGGECIPSTILSTFSKHFPNASLYNEYGLTESTGIAIATVNCLSNYESNLIIGNPIECVRAYIVNDDGIQVENGCEGELWLSGATIATGYLNEECNNHFFIKNSFDDDAMFSKIFKTGDYVKMTKNGIEFIGRKDNMTKIRGKKVNTYEIEKIVKEIFPNIELYVIRKLNIKRGQWMLCGFYKTTENIPPTVLRSATIEVFTFQMISKFIKVEHFPTTATGKISRKELSKYFIEDYEEYYYLNYLLESNHKIDKLKYGACKTLDLCDNEFDPNKNFYQHGGDSITVFYFLEEVKNLGVDITYNDLTTNFIDLCKEHNCNRIYRNTALTDNNHIQSVLFSNLKESEVDFIAQRMMDAFITKESMFMFHASKGFNFRMFFTVIVRECWERYPNLCMAVKIQDKIVGAFVTCPIVAEDLQCMGYLPIEQQELIHFCENNLLEKLHNNGHNIADALTMYVDSEVSSELSMNVFNVLCLNQFELVKKNGFTALHSFNMSPATKGVARTIFKSSVENIVYPHQFKLNEDFPYKDFDPGYCIEIAVDYLNNM
ncbi:plipastatin synthase subunit B [Hydra vulgaris]|uniref:Plipastatin synthase subunit B n=1 Tax=Hydra vulgaris TaxID=6087 RepID=A0ABM4CNV3_HYDVU